MAHLFTPNQGFFVRQPSWHGLEKVVLEDWPGSWEEARMHAGLDWEPESVPIYELVPSGLPEYTGVKDEQMVVPGYQRIIRDDNRLTLGIQSSAYRMISNSEFGGVIETVLGAEIDLNGVTQALKYEGVFELEEGRKIFAVIYLGDGIIIPGDNSMTYRFAVFTTRHDGSGGLRVVITNIRVVCANTAKMSETGAKEEETSFTIRHTGNWDERVAEVRDKVAEALESNQRYYELCAQLATAKVTSNTMTKMVTRFLPIGDDMGIRQQKNRYDERAVVMSLIEGPTVSDEHRKTPYGFLQAATEWSDHYRGYRTKSTYVNRQLTTKEPLKVKAFSIAKKFAGVK